MPGQRKHESGAKKRKLDEIKKERAKELLQKTPKLTNMWRSNQPAVAATTAVHCDSTGEAHHPGR